MRGVAFISAPGGCSLTFRNKTSAISPTRLRQYETPRRCRVTATENLYPTPDLPESIENPVTSNPATPVEAEVIEEAESPKTLFDKLNNVLRNRGRKSDSSDESAENALLRTTAEPLYVPDETSGKLDYVNAAKALWRIGWATWWVQLILTVISAVILLFSFAFPGVNIRSSASAVGFILSAVGVFVAFVSLFWTYSYTRLSLWLEVSADRNIEKAKTRITGKLRVGLIVSIIGLVISLTGLQAIVGTLLSRLLSAGIATNPYNTNLPGSPAVGVGIVQPVDVLVVQASANAMMALMAALTTTVWLRARSRKWQKTVNS